MTNCQLKACEVYNSNALPQKLLHVLVLLSLQLLSLFRAGALHLRSHEFALSLSAPNMSLNIPNLHS